MVHGLEKFKEYFGDYVNQYVWKIDNGMAPPKKYTGQEGSSALSYE